MEGHTRHGVAHPTGLEGSALRDCSTLHVTDEVFLPATPGASERSRRWSQRRVWNRVTKGVGGRVCCFLCVQNLNERIITLYSRARIPFRFLLAILWANLGSDMLGLYAAVALPPHHLCWNRGGIRDRSRETRPVELRSLLRRWRWCRQRDLFCCKVMSAIEFSSERVWFRVRQLRRRRASRPAHGEVGSAFWMPIET